MRVRRQPTAVASLERQRAAAGAREGASVGERAARVPCGRDPAAIAGDRTARIVDVDGEVVDDGPDASPLLALHGVEAFDERCDGTERDDVGGAKLATAGEVHGAYARLPGA